MNTQVIREVDVDFYDRNNISVTAKQYDKSSRYILVHCWNQGTPVLFDNSITSAFVRYRKADGLGVFNSATIHDDSSVLVELTEQMLAVAGSCYADIVIVKNATDSDIASLSTGSQLTNTSAAELVSTINMRIHVIHTPISNAEIESSYEFNALNDLIVKALADYEYVMKNAQASADASAESANAAKASETNAQNSADAAAESAKAAKVSETNAQNSADAAAESAKAAKVSETSAQKSADAAAESADAAKTSEKNAQISVEEANTARLNLETATKNADTKKSDLEATMLTANAVIQQILDSNIGVARIDITIPNDGWVPDTICPYRCDIANEKITSEIIPVLTILPDSMSIAQNSAFASYAQTMDGILRVYAETIPSAPIQTSVALLAITLDMIGGTTGSTHNITVATPEEADEMMQEVFDGNLPAGANIPIATPEEAQEMMDELLGG